VFLPGLLLGVLQVRELRKRSSNLPDDYLVVFAGELSMP
jgi:hypothetical protein